MSDVHDLTPKLLMEIRDEIRRSNERLGGIDERLAGLDKRVARLETGQARQHEQIKKIVEVIEEHAVKRIFDIERRLGAVEDRVGIER